MAKILLVDDDIAEISAVKRVIARAGHRPILATSSADALALLAQAAPALVVVGSTCENGEALPRFLEAEEVQGIPLVVLGEGAVPEGASLLPRPVDPAQLAERLAAAVRAAPPPAKPARKAAADALRARAEELRRAAQPAPDLAPEREEQDARSGAGEEKRRRDAEEEQLRTSIASARSDMEALRRRAQVEARRRAEAEAEAAVGAASGDAAPTAGSPCAAPAELREGTLAEVPAPRLLALAARAGLGGRLDFEGEASRSIYFEEGAVVGATSSDPAERVEELALRLGLVTREQYRLATSAAAPMATRRAALVLLERGFLKSTELTGLVRRRTEEVVFGVFGDAGARFRWVAAEVPADERTALERTTLALAVEGVRRRWLAPHVDAVLGGAGALLSPAAEGPSHDALALSTGERRAVALADGFRTLDEILAASPLDALSTCQALAALVLVDALSVRTFQGGRAAAAATAAIDLARVRDKLDQVRRADYFAILGIGRQCTPHEVREASARLRAEFDPSRFDGVREDGLEERLAEIRGVVADACDVLADDRLRHEYLRGLEQ